MMKFPKDFQTKKIGIIEQNAPKISGVYIKHAGTMLDGGWYC